MRLKVTVLPRAFFAERIISFRSKRSFSSADCFFGAPEDGFCFFAAWLALPAEAAAAAAFGATLSLYSKAASVLPESSRSHTEPSPSSMSYRFCRLTAWPPIITVVAFTFRFPRRPSPSPPAAAAAALLPTAPAGLLEAAGGLAVGLFIRAGGGESRGEREPAEPTELCRFAGRTADVQRPEWKSGRVQPGVPQRRPVIGVITEFDDGIDAGSGGSTGAAERGTRRYFGGTARGEET